MIVRACLCLLAGVYALQLSSFSALAPLLVVLFVICGLRATLLVSCGIALFHVAATGVIESRIAPDYEGDSIMTEIRVADFPVERGATTSFVATVERSRFVPARIRVTWYEAPWKPELGDVWLLELRLRRPRGSSNPGLFDYEAYLLRERIAATGYVVAGPRNRLLKRGDLGPIDALRQRTVRRIDAVAGSTDAAAVLAAISVGARHGVSAEQWQHYARTGTSHLMAISGLHVGLAAATGYYLALALSGLLLRGRCHRAVATVAALLTAFAYTMLSGLAVPAQRASVMIALGGLAVLSRRELRPPAILATACSVIVLVDPLSTMSPGFKLSFLAVAVLFVHARGRNQRCKLASMQLALFFGLLSLTAAVFGRLSIVAPFVNLVAVPVFSFVTVPCTLLGLLVTERLLPIAAASINVVNYLIEFAAALPVASVEPAARSGLAALVMLGPLAWIAMPRGWPGRSIAFLSLVAVMIYAPARAPHGCFDIDVLDVGQGLAVVITSQDQAVIYDTGPAWFGGGDAAQTVLLPYLRRRGVSRVDRLIVSHADLDHSGGLESLRAVYPGVDVLAGEPDAGSRRCHAGEGWSSNGVHFRLLWPPEGGGYTGNDASCVLAVNAGEYALLISGDIEQAVEASLVTSGTLRPANVVIVPHHGSKTSSTASFVGALRPQLAIVSAGFRNRWNLPHESVTDRWEHYGAAVISTADAGAVSLRICARDGISALRQHRQSQRRIWHE